MLLPFTDSENTGAVRVDGNTLSLREPWDICRGHPVAGWKSPAYSLQSHGSGCILPGRQCWEKKRKEGRWHEKDQEWEDKGKKGIQKEHLESRQHTRREWGHRSPRKQVFPEEDRCYKGKWRSGQVAAQVGHRKPRYHVWSAIREEIRSGLFLHMSSFALTSQWEIRE